SFEPEGRTLRWDAATGKELDAAPIRFPNDDRYGRRRYMTGAEFSPSGRWLVLGNDYGGRALYDVKTGGEQFALAAGAPNTPRDYRVSFSANESRAAVVGQVRGKAVNTVECVAHVWDVEAGVLVATRPVTWTDMNYDTNTHCALSPDGERLVV